MTVTMCTGAGADAPANGAVSKSDLDKHLSIATFSCDAGYELLGTQSVTCFAESSDEAWPTVRLRSWQRQ